VAVEVSAFKPMDEEGEVKLGSIAYRVSDHMFMFIVQMVAPWEPERGWFINVASTNARYSTIEYKTFESAQAAIDAATEFMLAWDAKNRLGAS